MPVMRGAEPFLFDAGAQASAGVVLCHGLTGTPQSMRPWGEYLRDAGFSVACPRLPGHGTRWQDLNRTHWEDWYGELERAFDAMLVRLDGGPVFAGGLSMGGTLVTRLAQRRADDLAGIVLVNPSYLTLRRDAVLLPVLSRVVPSFPGIAGDTRNGARELAYDRLPLRAAYSLSRLWAVVRADLPAVTVPVRLFHSAEDHVVEPVSSQILLDGVSSTDVEEVVLTESYHVATLDHDADTIFAGSAAFFSRRPTLPVPGDVR